MATYAAFKHIELYNVGNAKKRVLKPPGGGSSGDIFGPDGHDGLMPSTPRSVKNHMRSNIFAAPEPVNKTVLQGLHRYFYFGDGMRRQPNDSHNRLFGTPERPFTPAKNRLKSNIPIGGDESDSSLKHTNGNGVKHQTNGHTNGASNGHTNGHASNGHVSNGSENGVSKDGNPVTGEGYKPAGVEINTQVPALNGNGHGGGHHTAAVINKNRIPPGGFSSGLW
jgi:hypothetical protein